MTKGLAPKLSLENAAFRTLVGTNILFDGVGAISEIFIDPERNRAFLVLYEKNINFFLRKFHFDLPCLYKNFYFKGAIFALKTEIDLVCVGLGILECAFKQTLAESDVSCQFSLNEELQKLHALCFQYLDFKLRIMFSRARKRGLNAFYTDDTVTLGSGTGSWSSKIRLIDFENIPWDKIYNIPAVAITGSNGKTTTVILTKFIAEQAGNRVGYSSTESVVIAAKIIEEGDLSGPYGASLVLCDKNVDMAILELARGSIAKRGINITNLNAAVVTNLSNDHIGINGIDNISQLAKTKFLIQNKVARNGYHIINLDDELSRNFIEILPEARIFFSQKMKVEEIAAFLERKDDLACFIEDNILTVLMCHRNEFYSRDYGDIDANCHLVTNVGSVSNMDSSQLRNDRVGKSDRDFGYDNIKIVDIRDVPLTYNSLAVHNIENILAATCLSLALGCSYANIKKGLLDFNANVQNKGRLNIFLMNGYKNTLMIVDYAHNIASVNSVIKFAKNAVGQGAKITLLIGLTGDRIFMIDDMAKMLSEHNLDFIMLKTFNSRLRGAKVNEVARLLKNSLVKHGVSVNKLLNTVEFEVDATDKFLDSLEDNHAYLILSQDEIAQVIEKIEKFNA